MEYFQLEFYDMFLWQVLIGRLLTKTSEITKPFSNFKIVMHKRKILFMILLNQQGLSFQTSIK